MNYFKYIYDAVNAATATPVYALAAPQGVTSDFIVLSVNGVAVSESKDWQQMEQVSATLFLHFADADDAQAELTAIRAYLKTVNNTFKQAYMESMQAFYNEQQESIILAADFTFLINY